MGRRKSNANTGVHLSGGRNLTVGRIEFGTTNRDGSPIRSELEMALLTSEEKRALDGQKVQVKKDSYYLKMAQAVASGSKCPRAHCGTVIVGAHGNVVGTGYNGKPMRSTNDDVCYREGLPPGSQKENCCLHSEANAIMFSSPLDRRGGIMYVTGTPCADCTLLIMQSGITKLVYIDEGGKWNGGAPVIKKYGSEIEVVIYEPEEVA